jgi:hypothetical protein
LVAEEGPPLVLEAHGFIEMVLAQHGAGAPQQIGIPPAPLPSGFRPDQGGEGIGVNLPAGNGNQQWCNR